MRNQTKLKAFCANDCGRRIGYFNKHFCSNKCHWSFERRQVIEAFKAGTYAPTLLLNKVIRRYLIAKVGERCQRCGWAERHNKTGRVPLEIEHIDGNWRNCLESNLSVLCPNCHALTPTFRGMNRGHGRPGRPGLRPKPVVERAFVTTRPRYERARDLNLFEYLASQ